eukprot:TRINITY_DN7483_c0_g1_i14.p1 TRINITY_DN7483_c0_g1~~TRINITY_DN7483_c0_g1_i14.p1  ORF type:complete len:705 (-),score=205.25 TRINITY_DN7483_c0_g1_i14:637-2751(-)
MSDRISEQLHDSLQIVNFGRKASVVTALEVATDLERLKDLYCSLVDNKLAKLFLNLTKKETELTQEQEQLETELSTKNKELVLLKISQAESKELLVSRGQALVEYRNALAAYEARILLLNSERRQLLQKLEETTEISVLEAKIKNLESELESCDEHKKNTVLGISELSEQISELEKSLVQVEENLTRERSHEKMISEKLQECNRAVEGLEGDLSVMKSVLHGFSNEVYEWEEKLNLKGRVVEELTSKLKNLSCLIESKEKERSDKSEEIKRSLRRLLELAADNQNVEEREGSRNQNLVVHLDGLNSELVKFEEEIENLMRTHESLSGSLAQMEMMKLESEKELRVFRMKIASLSESEKTRLEETSKHRSSVVSTEEAVAESESELIKIGERVVHEEERNQQTVKKVRELERLKEEMYEKNFFHETKIQESLSQKSSQFFDLLGVREKRRKDLQQLEVEISDHVYKYESEIRNLRNLITIISENLEGKRTAHSELLKRRLDLEFQLATVGESLKTSKASSEFFGEKTETAKREKEKLLKDLSQNQRELLEVNATIHTLKQHLTDGAVDLHNKILEIESEISRAEDLAHLMEKVGSEVEEEIISEKALTGALQLENLVQESELEKERGLVSELSERIRKLNLELDRERVLKENISTAKEGEVTKRMNILLERNKDLCREEERLSRARAERKEEKKKKKKKKKKKNV